MQLQPDRRSFMAGAFSSAAVLGGCRPAGAAAPTAAYGCAVRADMLDRDRAYAAAVASRCRTVVPESALKWLDLRPSPDRFDFANADRIAAFAARHGLGLRGHTLAWYGAMPAWTEAVTARAEAQRLLTDHIETVVSRYRGLIGSWDVVNEPIPDQPASRDDLRPFAWSRALGLDYISLAFRAAAAADPAARLVLNEYDLEYLGERYAARRAGLLHVLRRLVDGGVPIHAVGLQAHLMPDRPLDRDGLQTFLREVRAMGLNVMVTELDVVDATLPGDVAQRDARVAASAQAFLTLVAEVSPPTDILTWGISDRYTWVPMYFTRSDGLPNRPLPLDADMNPKPLMAVIERFTRASP